MGPESTPAKQLILPLASFEPPPMVVSASRRTELAGLKPSWLVNALQRFPQRYKRDIHSVVLWTKDPTNIYAYAALREELSKYNLLVHFTLTGLGGTRIESTVPPAEVLLDRMPKLMHFLGDPRRLRWRFDPIVVLEREDGSHWDSSVYFEDLARHMVSLKVDNCYFSFNKIYTRKFAKRRLREAGIKIVEPDLDQQLVITENMKAIAASLGMSLYSCTQPQLEGTPGITPASCIDASLLNELHHKRLVVDPKQDKTMERLRPGCYCTESRDIGGYFPCGHGCVYCYAEAAVPDPNNLIKKQRPELDTIR